MIHCLAQSWKGCANSVALPAVHTSLPISNGIGLKHRSWGNNYLTEIYYSHRRSIRAMGFFGTFFPGSEGQIWGYYTLRRGGGSGKV